MKTTITRMQKGRAVKASNKDKVWEEVWDVCLVCLGDV